MHLPLVDVALVAFGAMLASAIPISVAGWGVREGALIARKHHGLSGLDRVSLVLGTQASGKIREPFECQVGRVAVQREPLQ